MRPNINTENSWDGQSSDVGQNLRDSSRGALSNGLTKGGGTGQSPVCQVQVGLGGDVSGSEMKAAGRKTTVLEVSGAELKQQVQSSYQCGCPRLVP